MKAYFLPFILLLYASCANKSKKSILSTENLTSWTITADQNTDSVFNTPKGASLKISKGTFKEKVTLEIKEAYTMQDMLLGGLVTESDGQPLASGGMIYINSNDGRAISLLKPIIAAIPTNFVDSQMQVYKTNGDSINWTKADTLPRNTVTNNIEIGRQIFRSQCASCHDLDRRLTGPALRGFNGRGNWQNRQEVYKWIWNPVAYMAEDNYTRDLHRQYGSVMQAFPNLSTQTIDAIINYVENEENNPFDDIVWQLRDTTAISDVMKFDKICSDTIYFENTDTTLPALEVDTQLLSTPELFTVDTVSMMSTAESVNGLRNGFTDKTTSRAYIFEIKTLGWYNIDAQVLGMMGTMLCDLQVRVTPEDFTEMNVYLVFPQYKDLSVGANAGDNIFHFNKVNEKIPLFVGARGVVIAFGSINDNVYVGSTVFTASKKQQLTVRVKKSSQKDFLELIKQNRIEGIDLKIQKQKMKVENRPCDIQYAVDSINL